MTAATAVEPIVSLRGAAFGYADNAVVRHVTLDVFPGGPTGWFGFSARSTSPLLMKIACPPATKELS